MEEESLLRIGQRIGQENSHDINESMKHETTESETFSFPCLSLV